MGVGSKDLGHEVFVHLTKYNHKVNGVISWVFAVILIKLFVHLTKISIFFFSPVIQSFM